MLAGLGWPWGARVIRAQTLTIRNRDFIAASRESGEKTWRIIIFEIIPNEISLIAANFVNTVLYAIGASVALAFVGLTNLDSWSLGMVLYWAQTKQRAAGRRRGGGGYRRAWRSRSIGTSLVLLNSGIDEIGNPRLRASHGRGRIGGHRIWTTDPTPVLAQLTAPRRRSGVRVLVRGRTPSGGADQANGAAEAEDPSRR